MKKQSHLSEYGTKMAAPLAARCIRPELHQAPAPLVVWETRVKEKGYSLPQRLKEGSQLSLQIRGQNGAFTVTNLFFSDHHYMIGQNTVDIPPPSLCFSIRIPPGLQDVITCHSWNESLPLRKEPLLSGITKPKGPARYRIRRNTPRREIVFSVPVGYEHHPSST